MSQPSKLDILAYLKEMLEGLAKLAKRHGLSLTAVLYDTKTGTQHRFGDTQ